MKHLTFAAILLSSTVAVAEEKSDPGYESKLSPFAAGIRTMQELGHGALGTPGRNASWEVEQEPSACDTVVGSLAGKAGDHLHNPSFAALSFARRDKWGDYITVADAPEVCARFRALKRSLPALAAIATAAHSLMVLTTTDPTTTGPGWGAGYAQDGAACLSEVDAAIADGVPADLSVPMSGATTTLAKARVEVCQAVIDEARKFDAAGEAMKKAAYERIAAPYRKLGVKGDRLELFVTYDATPFYGKGCTAEIHDIKKLVKAKVLFHWLINGDGTHTIRKYKIKGNRYSISEKTYDRESKAYRGCR
jgi:hypothetical protein